MGSRYLIVLLGLMFSGTAVASDGPYPSDPQSIAAGQDLAESLCSGCHAVGSEGTSPKEGAPEFRTLSGRYPLETLEESLAEGIVTAHRQMPEFTFEPKQIDVLLGYLTSIQAQ